MMCKDVVKLASVSTKRNQNGYPEATVQMTEIFADAQSAKRQEFYEALRSGRELTLSCKVRSADYARQKYVKIDGIWYEVVRSYTVEDWTELNCTEVKALEKWMEEDIADDDKRDPD